LGEGLTLEGLTGDFDAVFLAIGLAGVNALQLDGLSDAVGFIADLRQAGDLSSLPVGRNVAVIGGGMTAVDAAVQSKALGAETVTIVYRRGRDAMGASVFEQDLATSRGVRIVTNAIPVGLHTAETREIELEYTSDDLSGTGETFRLPADQVFAAIGQKLVGVPDGIDLDGGKIKVTSTGRTSMSGVWAGGDCAAGGDDLTVTAVAQGRDAAEDIHETIC
jgi:glutamate synthase (NADPH/NADH) small chain